jgi:hypothetical protein
MFRTPALVLHVLQEGGGSEELTEQVLRPA